MANKIDKIDMYENETYRKILEHRGNCPKWTKEFCLDCFGGGLTRFLRDMETEHHKKHGWFKYREPEE